MALEYAQGRVGCYSGPTQWPGESVVESIRFSRDTDQPCSSGCMRYAALPVEALDRATECSQQAWRAWPDMRHDWRNSIRNQCRLAGTGTWENGRSSVSSEF